MVLDKKVQARIKRMVKDHPGEVLDALLELDFWPTKLKAGADYERRGDDTDGCDNSLSIGIGAEGVRSGDVWVDVYSVEIKSHIEEDSFSLNHCFRSGLG